MEAGAAAVMIVANVYCAGKSSLSALTGFNYCITKVIYIFFNNAYN